MATDLPPNIANTVASGIVRAAESTPDLDTIAERQHEDEQRRREEALREAAARQRTPDTSGR